MSYLAYEIDQEGRILNGSYKDLLECVRGCASIKIGLGRKAFEEIIPFISVAYTDDLIIGIQPYHKSSERIHSFINSVNSVYVPYLSIFLYTTERKMSILRRHINGLYMDSTFTENPNYFYYKWFVSDEKWQLVYNSTKDYNDTSKKDKMVSFLKKEAQDMKLSFRYKGIDYIVVPNIIYFPKQIQHDKQPMPECLTVKTYPVLLFENNGTTINWTKFELAECLITDSGQISVLSYHDFDLSLPGRNKISRIFRYLSRYKKTNKLKHFEIKTEVKWYIKTK
jgi:hypothetical protein